MSNELKPCPFCGGTQIIRSDGAVIMCDDCGGKALMDKGWNNRPIEDALRKELEELKASIININRAYKWYNEDSYENCISVVSDAIYFAMEKIERIESK